MSSTSSSASSKRKQARGSNSDSEDEVDFWKQISAKAPRYKKYKETVHHVNVRPYCRTGKSSIIFWTMDGETLKVRSCIDLKGRLNMRYLGSHDVVRKFDSNGKLVDAYGFFVNSSANMWWSVKGDVEDAGVTLAEFERLINIDFFPSNIKFVVHEVKEIEKEAALRTLDAIHFRRGLEDSVDMANGKPITSSSRPSKFAPPRTRHSRT